MNHSIKSLLLVLLIFITFLLDVSIGSIEIPFGEVIKILLNYAATNETWQIIVLKIRLPNALTAVLAGSALSVAGLLMQTLFRNPLAGPSILGLTSGAGLGVALVMLASGAGFGLSILGNWTVWGNTLVVLAAIAGSILVMCLVLMIALWIQDNVSLLIVGMMIGNLTASVVALLQYYSSPEELQTYLLWTFGSLGGLGEIQLMILGFAVFVGLFYSFLLAKNLNLLLLGENYAQSMGLSIFQIRMQVIFLTSILAGSITAFCGPIGFVGIAVPHLTRGIFKTSKHQILIPYTCLIGILLMLACDILSKLPNYHSVLPINVITALVGSPVVIWVILQRRHRN